MRCRGDRNASLHCFRQRAELLRLFCAYAQNKRRGLALKVAYGDLTTSLAAFTEILLRFSSRFHIFQVAVGAPSERRLV